MQYESFLYYNYKSTTKNTVQVSTYTVKKHQWMNCLGRVRFYRRHDWPHNKQLETNDHNNLTAEVGRCIEHFHITPHE